MSAKPQIMIKNLMHNTIITIFYLHQVQQTLHLIRYWLKVVIILWFLECYSYTMNYISGDFSFLEFLLEHLFYSKLLFLDQRFQSAKNLISLTKHLQGFFVQKLTESRYVSFSVEHEILNPANQFIRRSFVATFSDFGIMVAAVIKLAYPLMAEIKVYNMNDCFKDIIATRYIFLDPPVVQGSYKID